MKPEIDLMETLSTFWCVINLNFPIDLFTRNVQVGVITECIWKNVLAIMSSVQIAE